jgi:hypothetical protein
VRTLVNCLEQKVGIACKYFEPKDDPEVQFKFQKSINQIDMFIQMHQVGMQELQDLITNYANQLKKVDELSPALVQNNALRR